MQRMHALWVAGRNETTTYGKSATVRAREEQPTLPTRGLFGKDDPATGKHINTTTGRHTERARLLCGTVTPRLCYAVRHGGHGDACLGPPACGVGQGRLGGHPPARAALSPR